MVAPPMLSTLAKTGENVFFVWVTLTERKWVILRERRGSKDLRKSKRKRILHRVCAYLDSEVACLLTREARTEEGEGIGSDGPLDFARLVRTNQAMVYSIAYHFFHDRATAEELAQDVFLMLHRRFGKMQSEAHVTNWLRKVTCHRCIDRARRRDHWPEVRLDPEIEPAIPGDFPDPFLAKRLRKLVASLPEKRRLLVILRYQEELEPEEIARVLNIPLRTIRTQLFRTLELLREKAGRVLGEVK
jgi:RNA polymerase sigma-70 factor (ECF subfamily)